MEGRERREVRVRQIGNGDEWDRGRNVLRRSPRSEFTPRHLSYSAYRVVYRCGTCLEGGERSSDLVGVP